MSIHPSFDDLRNLFPKAPDYVLMDGIRFSKAFSKYFPHIVGNNEIILFEMDWIDTHVKLNPLNTTRRSKAKREIRKLKKMIYTISEFEIGYTTTLFQNELSAEENALKEGLFAILDFILAIDEWKTEPDISVELVIKTFIEKADKAIEITPDTSNIKWDAVHAVDGLRILWWRNTGKNAPYSINPASKFASFLYDAFKFLRINADAISAFKRWEALKKEEAIENEKNDIVPNRKFQHPYDYLLKTNG